LPVRDGKQVESIVKNERGWVNIQEFVHRRLQHDGLVTVVELIPERFHIPFGCGDSDECSRPTNLLMGGFVPSSRLKSP
jgi:hypothetical protein